MSIRTQRSATVPKAPAKADPELAPGHSTPLDESVANALGNEILLSSAASTTVQRVEGTSAASWSTVQSRPARAWSRGGRVD